MKTNLLILVMMAGGLNLFAQEHARGPLGARRAENMKSELSLTDEQFARVEAVHKKFRSAYGHVLSDTLLTEEEVLVERKRLLNERDSDMKEVLTEDQYVKWMSTRPAETHRGYGRGPGTRSVDDMKGALGLTDEQAKKIVAANKAFAAQFQGLRADTTLTREGTARAIRQKADERRASIKKVLNPAQYEKFLVFEAEHRRRGANDRRH